MDLMIIGYIKRLHGNGYINIVTYTYGTIE